MRVTIRATAATPILFAATTVGGSLSLWRGRVLEVADERDHPSRW
jgi:hypothetical protein